VPCLSPAAGERATGDAADVAEIAYGAAEEADLQRRLEQLGYLA